MKIIIIIIINKISAAQEVVEYNAVILDPNITSLLRKMTVPIALSI